MIRLLLTDTHYGWKQNSTTWLNSQMRFLDEQIIPWLKKQTDDVRIIHLGDVFDSRSAINPMIAKAVRERFAIMRSLCKDFYIVAGNHDFYSPNSDDIDVLTMVFRDMDINLVIKESVYDDEDAFIPWYSYKNLTQLPDNVKNIYVHADIFGEDYKSLGNVRNVRIFSGHIHIPNFDKSVGLYNLGSCYSLNFADSNQDRYYYTLDDDGVHMFNNESSIKFWRIYEDEIFEPLHDIDDYYEIYISQKNMQSTRYQARLNDITKQYKNLTILPINIDMKLLEKLENECIESYNIDSICEKSIPKHLKDKFEELKKYINSHNN